MAKDLRYDAIYARQSIDKKDSVSIEAQIEDCKMVCSANARIYKIKDIVVKIQTGQKSKG